MEKAKREYLNGLKTSDSMRKLNLSYLLTVRLRFQESNPEKDFDQ